MCWDLAYIPDSRVRRKKDEKIHLGVLKRICRKRLLFFRCVPRWTIINDPAKSNQQYILGTCSLVMVKFSLPSPIVSRGFEPNEVEVIGDRPAFSSQVPGSTPSMILLQQKNIFYV